MVLFSVRAMKMKGWEQGLGAMQLSYVFCSEKVDVVLLGDNSKKKKKKKTKIARTCEPES
jgi:hypothetical protein